MEQNFSLKDYQNEFRKIIVKETKKDFATHLIFYIIINAGLIIFNRLVTPDVNWFWWPLLGWGAGLMMDFFASLNVNKDLERKEALAEKRLMR